MTFFLEITTCTAIFYTLFYALYRGKNCHRFNRFYLLSALVLSVLLPALHLPVFVKYVTVKNVPQVAVNQVNTEVVVGWFTQPENLLFAVWFIGFLLFLTRFFIRFFAIRKIVNSGEIEDRSDYKIVYTGAGLPLSSFMNYLFIPQHEKDKITAWEIKHEETHIYQKHSLDLLFLEMYQAVFWFNPLLVFYRRSLREIHEYLADATSISAFGKTPYTAFLIEQISARKTAHLTHNFSSLFKKRIDMIDNNLNLKTGHILAIIPVLAFTFLIFSCEETVVPITENAVPEGYVEQIDTIILFDPETKEEWVETVRRVVKAEEEDATGLRKNSPKSDTIITYDKETGKETMQIIITDELNADNEPKVREKVKVFDPETGVEVAQYNVLQEGDYIRENTGIDTIIVFDPETFEETMTIVNRATGNVIKQE